VSDQEAASERIRSGDRREFESFYHANAGRILQFLRHMTGDHQAASDILQEVFLHLWERTNGFDPARGSLINYVFGIARNRAAEWRRHCGRFSDDSGLSHENCEPEAGHERQGACLQDQSRTETAMLVEDVFDRLKPDARGLLWLREVEGHSYAELEDIFSIPLGTVKSRLFAAREELRELWNARTKTHL
jgi:RNA polymerase sigma-70 factor (ECF subfamily)